MSIYNRPQVKAQRRRLRVQSTDAERFLWSTLRNRQLMGVKFFRQYSVGPYILDFYAPSRRLAIELDGGQHAEPAHEQHDQQRTTYVQHHGITVVRFWNTDILANITGVVDELMRLLSRTPPNLPLSQGEESGRPGQSPS